MGWFDKLTRRSSAPVVLPFEQMMARIDGVYGQVIAGERVSVETALQVSTVLACADVIAKGCATPAMHVYRELRDGSRQLATNIPEYRMLSRRPNEWQTSYEFRRTMSMHAALTEGALAVKVMRGNRVAELIPVQPGHWQIERLGRYEHRFRVADEYGLVGVFEEDQVLHLPGLQWERVKGLGAVKMAAASIGLAMASERTQATLHANGGRPAGLLSTDQKLGAEPMARLKDAWDSWMRANKNGTAILDSNLKYTPITMSGVDAQHLETRRFQVEEICRGFGVFPIMIGHSDKTATFASSEAFFAAHLKHTLAPWHEMWKQRIDEFVLDGSGPLFVEFDTRYLSSGSMKDRAVWARTMAEMGVYTRNELRDEEGKDPLPGLDEPLTPLNMTGAAPEGEPDGDETTPA
jgi:HK97 family phage portal protein